MVSCSFSVNSVHSVCNALAYLKFECPDLVISDIMMKDLNGYDFVRLVKLDKLLIHIPIIFLTAKSMTNDRIKGYDLGCNAYVTKPFDPRELISIIHNLFSYNELLKANFLSNNRVSSMSSNLYKIFSLTSREKKVLIFLSRGYMNKEIAMVLNVSIRNVEKYVSRLLAKTNTRNRVELVRLFLGANDGSRTRV